MYKIITLILLISVGLNVFAQGQINRPQKKTQISSKYDISNIASAFISKNSGGFAPWTCMQNTGIKSRNNDLELHNDSYYALYSAPLTSNGKPLIKNQLGKAEEWDIVLKGPSAGAQLLIFSATPQYVDLNDMAKTIANSLNASYISKRESSYGKDCVYLYSLRTLRLAIYCSFGAHGGTIDVIIGSSNAVNGYINSLL